MPRAYPHLKSDAFPHLDTVDPYRRKVPFDYGRYDYTSLIKLCRVPWPMDYRHVVNWAGATQRDAYFESIPGKTIELANGFVHTQTDSIRVDVPYDEALTYSYVYMHVPMLTEDEAIRHEGTDGVRVVCAWIQEAIYFAPSATELVLEVDFWTTYLPHLAPVELMLHRGHAPAYAIGVDEYLADPKDKCTMLLTPDVNFGVSDVSAHAELVDIAQGEKMIVLASTIPYTAAESLTQATQRDTGSSTPPIYYDTGLRDGRQVGIDGYEWHYDGMTYENLRNPSAYTGTGDAMPVYTALYALPASSVAAALQALSSRLPQFIQSIQAAYVMPRRALVLKERTYNVGGIRMFAVEPQANMHKLADIRLTKELFGYPSRYADIAKLYTSPYAHMILSDTLGNEIEVRIEDMGNSPALVEQISPMHECLRWDVLIVGANDAGATGYVWQTLTGDDVELSLPGTDLARYTLSLGIPTYALYLDGRTAHAARNYYDAQTQRDSAVNTYQSTMRSANTGYANAVDSANTAQANANESAATAETNAYASAEINVTNVANNGLASQGNTNVINAGRDAKTARANLLADHSKDISSQNLFDSLYLDDEYTMQASDINLKSEAVSGALSTVGALASGNLVGAVSNGLSAVVNITTSAALSQLSSENIEGKEAVGADYQTKITAEQIANATKQTEYDNTVSTSVTNRNAANANTNARNSANTAEANATRSKNTAQTNAGRTSATSKNNAGYARNTQETNAKQALELARHNYDRQGHAHDLDAPTPYGAVSGDHTADALMRRVVQMRIETQSKSAIARAGDAMLRYGYIYDGFWIVTDWCPEEHDACYWEALDVLINAEAVTNPSAERVFETILREGVTVWNDPAKIGGLPW